MQTPPEFEDGPWVLLPFGNRFLGATVATEVLGEFVYHLQPESLPILSTGSLGCSRYGLACLLR